LKTWFMGTVLLLCAAGGYASAFMARKAERAVRGELSEPSVVETPRARLFGSVSNAAIGLVYYLALAAALPFLDRPLVWGVAFAAALAAATMSAYLAYSLLFITRRPCAFCWTSHAVNWLLVALLLAARPH
jgi:uncharacterized membrane protein